MPLSTLHGGPQVRELIYTAVLLLIISLCFSWLADVSNVILFNLYRYLSLIGQSEKMKFSSSSGAVLGLVASATAYKASTTVSLLLWAKRKYVRLTRM
jgi:hypothetical protein